MVMKHPVVGKSRSNISQAKCTIFQDNLINRCWVKLGTKRVVVVVVVVGGGGGGGGGAVLESTTQ